MTESDSHKENEDNRPAQSIQQNLTVYGTYSAEASEDIHKIDIISNKLTVSGKEKQREIFVKVFVIFFSAIGVILLSIATFSSNSDISSTSMDLFKLWLGALISVVSVIVTYYFRD